MKFLCAQPGKSEDDVSGKTPATRSRRFPIRSMFLGVILNPISSKSFDGKILLTRVSRTEIYKQHTHNQNFSKHAATNAMLCNGEGYNADIGLVIEETALSNLWEALAASYQLELEE